MSNQTNSPSAAADLTAIYDAFGIGSEARTLSVLLTNLRNMKHFTELLWAVEREFFMVPGEPSDEPEDDGCEPSDECLVNCWGSTKEQYIEQFRAALAAKAAASVAQGLDVDAVMTRIQEFASAWSVVGGRFDDGTAMERAEECKAEIRAILAQAAPSVSTEKCFKCGHPAHSDSCVNVAPSAQQVEQLPVELRAVAETVAEGAGFWATCTGCYDTEDGRPTQKYAHSDVFGCELGDGCRECGGIGAAWDDTDYAEMAEFMMREDATPAPSASPAIALHAALMELYKQVKDANEETDLNPVFGYEVDAITRLLDGDLFTPSASPAALTVPEGFAIKRVEGHGWIIDPPTGSRWIAHEGTPAGDFIAALLAASPADQADSTHSVPEGYALVPLEPTPAIQQAAAMAIRFDTTVLNKIWTANAVYRAAIGAAMSTNQEQA